MESNMLSALRAGGSSSHPSIIHPSTNHPPTHPPTYPPTHLNGVFGGAQRTGGVGCGRQHADGFTTGSHPLTIHPSTHPLTILPPPTNHPPTTHPHLHLSNGVFDVVQKAGGARRGRQHVAGPTSWGSSTHHPPPTNHPSTHPPTHSPHTCIMCA